VMLKIREYPMQKISLRVRVDTTAYAVALGSDRIQLERELSLSPSPGTRHTA